MMNHLNWNECSVRARAKANADFAFMGYCHLRGLVKAATVCDLEQSAERKVYCPIFNKFRQNSASKRAAAKACDLGVSVIQQVFQFLKTCLIAGPEHVLEMGRGASFLRSQPGVVQQDTHTDFDFQGIRAPHGFRKSKPFSIWIALADDSYLWLKGIKHSFKAGDVVVFAGDCQHSGAANESRKCNYRLFCYVPTRMFDVPWSFDQCVQQVKNTATQVDGVDEIKRLHDVTNPLSERFDKDEYAKYLYDRMSGRFFNFSVPLWLGGLDTAEPLKDSHAQGLPSLPSCNPVTACYHCPHFNIDEFMPINRDERALLNRFRTQCSYCKSFTLKHKRARDEQ